MGDAVALAIGQEPGVRIVVGSTQPTKAGKHARVPDLVVVLGDPATRIGDVRKVQIVFKQGVGYDPAKLVESVRGKVGLF